MADVDVAPKVEPEVSPLELARRALQRVADIAEDHGARPLEWMAAGRSAGALQGIYLQHASALALVSIGTSLEVIAAALSADDLQGTESFLDGLRPAGD